MKKYLLVPIFVFAAITANAATWTGFPAIGETITPQCFPPNEYLVLDSNDVVVDGGICAGDAEPDGGNSITLSENVYFRGSTYTLQIWDSGDYNNLISQSNFTVYNFSVLNANTRSITSTSLSSAIINTLEALWPIFLVGIGIALAFTVAEKIILFFRRK